MRLFTNLIPRVAARAFGTIRRVNTMQRAVALTFDDGPNPEVTPRLLDLLEDHGARATFFMVGRFANEHPDIVRRAEAAGHCVGNHTQDHISLPVVSRSERRAQIIRCSESLQPYGSRLFRPPYGHQSIPSHFDVRTLGYQAVGWDVVGLDWLDHPAGFIEDRVATGMVPGSIILLHDRLFSAEKPEFFDRTPMLEAVKSLLENHSREFRFVTVPELMSLGRPERANWYLKGDLKWLHSLRGEAGESRTYDSSARRG